ncbi:hypothetical protein [Moorella sulfitireducens (nom. illeg.)]|uniref:hypothetical protein n=1 Tax=Neomoorella sulfitireducens TaxID=2972948 RepID=UPI0021ACAE78|nr:hypothetical protein [Moorella sulfitireducens]
MLGIPTPGSEEYNIFLVNFWSSLYAGLISAIVTGLIVGLILWKLQNMADAKQKAREYGRQLAKICDRAGEALEQMMIFGGNTKSLVPTLDDIKNLVQEIQVQGVSHAFTKNKCFILLEHVITLQKELINQAMRIDLLISNLVRQGNYTEKIDPVNDGIATRYICARFIGWSDDKILPYLSISSNECPEWILRRWEECKANEEISHLWQEFNKGRAELYDSLIQLSGISQVSN